MESLHNDSSQWEQSKENIQPLKQGRKATVLSVVLDDNATQKLHIVRHKFEEELRTYSGDDPLDVWYRYALWVEQNYPKGGNEGKLSKLIEKCLFGMYRDADLRQKYDNDERLLDLWTRYANISPNPLEVYQTMEAKGLCLSLADFYINWSWEMEKAGNYKRADAIYEKGLRVAAKPLCNLEEAHKKFQVRVSRSTIEGRIGEQEVKSLEQERVALTSLKSQGHKAPTNRSGAALAGPAGRLSQDLPSRTDGGPTFMIFKDTSSKGVSSNPSVGPYDQGSLAIGPSTHRENTKKPSQWNKVKNRTTMGVVPVEDVDKYQTPKFSVHEDECTSEQRENQPKLSAPSHVLSQHKEDFDDWNVPLFIQEPFDPKAQPQYCKHKVYCGTEEFSFEELRAAQFAKKEREKKEREREKKEKENEIQQMRDMLRKQEEMIQKLLLLQTQEKETDSKKPNQVIFQDSWVTINKSVNASVNASNLHDESRNVPSQYNVPVPIKSGKESANSDPVPPIIAHPCPQEQGNLSTSGNCRALSFTDPTGDAANIMEDIWSATFSHSLSQPSSDRGAAFPEAASSENSATPVYEDDGSETNEPFGRKSMAPFQIFSDPVTQNQKTEPTGMQHPTQEAPSSVTETYPETQDENRPPPGMVQQHRDSRRLTGILQPSEGIPVLKDTEEEKIQSERIEEGNNEDRLTSDVGSLYNEDLEDVVPLDGKQLEDFTIKMPNNESMFSHLAKVVSTPVPWSLRGVPQSSSTRNDVTLTTDGEKFFPQVNEEETNDRSLKNNSQVKMMPPPSTTKGHTSVTTASTTTLPEECLSTIMEASREYRSSSSSSGCSTISSTLPGHSVHGISQPGNFFPHIRHHTQIEEEVRLESVSTFQAGDFTKSGYLADKSRGESLAESLPYAAAATQPKSEGPAAEICSAITEMMKEYDNMLQSPTLSQREMVDASTNINPFDEDIIDQILSKLEFSVCKRGGHVALRENLPCLKAGTEVTLGMEIFHVYKQCGEGAYAKVYKAITLDPLNVTLMASDTEEDYEHQFILKVQKPACPWEFYICHELRQRLKGSLYPESILNSVVKADRGYFFIDGSIFVSKYHQYGTLLDVVNGYRVVCQTVPEEIAMFLMVEIFSILEAVHGCSIIHADIKPDNFLIQDFPEFDQTSDIFAEGPVCLKLIDFGRSIDMKAFPQGTTFTEVVTTKKFTCCEMRDGRPWTYQIDYFGVAAIAHLLLFGTYMDVMKTDNGDWEITGTFKRYWKKDLWENLFSTLLNVPSCSVLPNLSNLKNDIISTFYKARMHKEIKFKFHSLQQMRLGQK